MTPEMSGKKQTNKGKGKQAQEAPATDTWRTSKCTDTDLLRLVSEGLLEPKEIVQWRAARSDPTPYEGVDELVLFQHFIECGLTLPASDFLQGLLYYYGIQIHQLNPNSIMHISIFVQ